MIAHEVNFDGLVGPTHNYAGLAFGNIASATNQGRKSNPKKAALEGLAKMMVLARLGVRQAVLPPHPRPDVSALRRLGFSGPDQTVLQTARRDAPHLLAACASASAMWTANAATVSPSADTADGRVHFTPANLVSQLHRSLEAPTTARILKAIFRDEAVFAHHPPLPCAATVADEGAANHLRLAPAHGQPGIEVFVYGREGRSAGDALARKFPARQTLEASQAVVRAHQLDNSALFLRQNAAAIDAGAFHNDVVAVANENVLLCHAQAWEAQPDAIKRLARALRSRGGELIAITVNARQVSLAEAVCTYLFNSQIVSLADGSMALIAPQECRRAPRVRDFLDRLPEMGTPIRKVHFVPVRQSMRNGGGPACLRLRVVLNERELAAAHPGVFLTPQLFDSLSAWIERHYREELRPADLPDPKLLDESRRALDELTALLALGSIYDFQGFSQTT
ncbi:MAG: N-succinylarginine dihydrolase [Tepidisphaeraceae bacterium]|jgi:succinylarginine dihydrolase